MQTRPDIAIAATAIVISPALKRTRHHPAPVAKTA